MKTVNLVFCALLIVVASAAKIPSEFNFSGLKSAIVDPRIINGKNATEGQFPYQVSLRRTLNDRHFCGASIISERFILTAAHCVQGPNSNPKNIYAVIGALRTSQQDGVKANIDRIVTHKKFEIVRTQNDISLLRTATEMIFSDIIQPIALPTRNLPKKRNTTVVLSGWGQMSNVLGSPAADNLQFTLTQAISLNKCRERLKDVPKSDEFEPVAFDSVVCTIYGDSGVCYGDSGGPLVDVSDEADKSLVGIVSWTALQECAKGYPDGYTRVYSFLDWIHKRIEENSDF